MTRIRIRRGLALALVGLLAMGTLSAPDAALAQSRKPTPAAESAENIEKVNIQLMVVHAKEGEAYIDPRLKNIERHLEILRYNNFTVLQSNKSPVAVGKETSFQVEGGRKVTVGLLSVDAKRARVRVQMFKQGNKLVDTTVAINRGSTMMVAGPRHEGGILILPITADY
ncbi:MAG: hypothetical protein H6740_07870 [Alphaproteobacteria bacterium]|nr:hypothetical protein [Alphaproteobacteria bacterium]